MMKRIFTLLACLLTSSSFAADASLTCPNATTPDNPNFCDSFKKAAICHCTTLGTPEKICQDMNNIYNLMITRFGTIEAACRWEHDKYHDTDVQTCVDDWSCYRTGRDSKGKPCNAAGSACSA